MIVVRRGAVAPLLGELRHLVSVRGLARWHQPEALVVLPELPRNAGGKVDKRRLAESVAPLVARRAQPPTGPSE